MIKECWSCGDYKAYYTKGFLYFDKQNTGICKNKNEVTEKHCTCEQWRSNIRCKTLRKKVALKKLTDLLDTMASLKQIISEEQEDEP